MRGGLAFALLAFLLRFNAFTLPARMPSVRSVAVNQVVGKSASFADKLLTIDPFLTDIVRTASSDLKRDVQLKRKSRGVATVVAPVEETSLATSVSQLNTTEVVEPLQKTAAKASKKGVPIDPPKFAASDILTNSTDFQLATENPPTDEEKDDVISNAVIAAQNATAFNFVDRNGVRHLVPIVFEPHW